MNLAPDATHEMKAWSELVRGGFDESIVRDAARRAQMELGGRAHIAFVFVSCDYEDALPDLVELVQIHAHCPRVVGCSAGGLVGVGREEEGGAGFSLLVLRLDGAEICVNELATDSDSASWSEAKRWNSASCKGWILLGNPVAMSEDWMRGWNDVMGATPTYGGLASGSQRAEDLFLFTEHGSSDAAAIAIGLRGGVKLGGLVSQGCKPIGEPLTITRADHNMIHQLACKSAYDQLQATFHALPEKDRERAQGNILVGLAMSEYVDEFHTGDFLVRSIIGGDPNKGILAVGTHPRVGQTLQFQLRDRESADAELREMLSKKRIELERTPFAGLLFTCAGRGQNLFGSPHHDAGLVEAAFGSVPLAGMFCNGEIGTVGDKTHLHGFTASGAFFVPA